MDRRFRRDKLEKKDETKKRVMVLGTGWGGHAVSKVVDTGLYEVVVVSPRNYFLFTPMLAGSSVGTVDYRSIIEPIRAANPLADYYEARGEWRREGSCVVTCVVNFQPRRICFPRRNISIHIAIAKLSPTCFSDS
jgi:hypothetical protein